MSNQPKSQAAQPGPIRVSTGTVKPTVTFVLLGITVFVFLAGQLLDILTGNNWLLIFFLKVRQLILAGQLWRLITPTFLHSSLLHIGFNLYALYILGTRLEPIYGHWRFLALYLLAGFGGNVLSFVLTPAPSLGSSTAIFGLLAAEVVFIIQNKQLFGERTRPMLTNLAMILLVNLMIGLSPSMNIDNYGHLGGFLAGIIFSSLAGPKWKMMRNETSIQLVDIRPRKDWFIAGIMVLVGFALIASVPFYYR